MKYTIKGLTNATLTINSLKLTIRGNSKNIKYYPNSVFYNVEVSDQIQMNEIVDLAKKGYLTYEASEPPAQPEKVVKSIKRNEQKAPVQVDLSNSNEQKSTPNSKKTSDLDSKVTSEKSKKIKKVTKALSESTKTLKEELEENKDISIVMVGGKAVKGRNMAHKETGNTGPSILAEQQLLEESLKQEPIDDPIIWVDGNGEKIKPTSTKLPIKDVYSPDELTDLDEFIE